MLKVHHLGVSQSDKVVWLCEELGLDYELVFYDRDPVTRLAPAAYKALHPAGTAPIIQDGDVTLAESAAVFEYILGRYGDKHEGGRLTVAPDAPNYADYLYWFHYAAGTVQPAMLVEIIIAMLGIDRLAVAALTARGDNAWTSMEERLGKVPYLAGDAFTAADMMNFFTLTTGRLFVAKDLAPYPNIRAYIQRVLANTKAAAALAKADPGLDIPFT